MGLLNETAIACLGLVCGVDRETTRVSLGLTYIESTSDTLTLLTWRSPQYYSTNPKMIFSGVVAGCCDVLDSALLLVPIL